MCGAMTIEGSIFSYVASNSQSSCMNSSISSSNVHVYCKIAKQFYLNLEDNILILMLLPLVSKLSHMSPIQSHLAHFEKI